jgi:hypothetical protein
VIALLVQRIVASILTIADLRGAARTSEVDRDETAGRVLLLGLAGALAILGLWRLLFWPWLFFPVSGVPTQIQPRLSWASAYGWG